MKAKKGTTRTTEQNGWTFDDSDVMECPRGLYDHGSVANSINGIDAVTDEHIDQYHELGYLVINNAVGRETLADAEQALATLIDSDDCDPRCIQFEKWAAHRLNDLTREQKQDAVRKFMGKNRPKEKQACNSGQNPCLAGAPKRKLQVKLTLKQEGNEKDDQKPTGVKAYGNAEKLAEMNSTPHSLPPRLLVVVITEVVHWWKHDDPIRRYQSIEPVASFLRIVRARNACRCTSAE